MHLLQFRIIGHPDIPDSPWLEVGAGLTVLQTEKAAQAHALLRMLQTVNPPYECHHRNPFGNFPLYRQNRSYTQRIIPAKRTVALAIFASSPELVDALAGIDPLFYETDRIELGRRRDYSRWTNFVELAGSARWSEIADSVMSAWPLIPPHAAQAVDSLRAAMQTWRAADRLKGPNAVVLKTQLQTLRSLLPEEHRSRLDPCFQAIDRAHHFSQAKEVVADRLPVFLSLPAGVSLPLAGEAETGDESFAFLAARWLAAHPDRAGRKGKIHQLNGRLRGLCPDLPIRLREASGRLALEHTPSTASATTTLSPGMNIKAMMAGCSVLHQAIYGCEPIFLLDCAALHLVVQDRIDLFKNLQQWCQTRQCLVAPDNDFIAWCDEAFGHQGDNSAKIRLLRI